MILHLRNLGHSTGTKVTYGQGVKAFLKFSKEYGIAKIRFPQLQAFIVYMVNDMNLAFRTIKTYTYAVKDWAIEHGHKDPTLDHNGSRHL